MPSNTAPLASPQGAGLSLRDVGFRPPNQPSFGQIPQQGPRPMQMPFGSGAGSMQGLPFEPNAVRDLGRTQLPPVRSGLARAGTMAANTGPQLPGPSVPGSSLIARGGRWAAHPNLARGAGALGRGLGGMALASGGAAAGDVIGDNPLGNAVGAGTGVGGYAMLAGGAPAAAAGLGVGLGVLGGEQFGDEIGGGFLGLGDEQRKASNVTGNIARSFGGGRSEFTPQVDPTTGEASGALVDLETQGVSVVDLVNWMAETNTNGDIDDRSYLATKLADAGIAGAKFKDGQVILEGDAMDLVDKLSDAETGDTGIKMIRELARQGAAEDEVGAAFGTYTMAKAEGLEDDEALAAGVNAVGESRAMVQAEEDAWATAMAMQQQALSYMQPVTGRMRADADFLYDQMTSDMSGFTPQEAQYLQRMAASERDEQHALANSYEAQIQMQPYMVLQDQYNKTQQSIADQMTQQMISQFVGQQTGTMGMGGGGMEDALMGGATGSPLPSSGATMSNPMGSMGQFSPQMGPQIPPNMTMDFLARNG
jgi:hypothetical protein